MLHRATAIEDFTGRTLIGRAYRYDYPSRVTDDGWATSYYEEMLKGSDSRTLTHRTTFPLTKEHSQHGGIEIGTVTFHRSTAERSLMFEARVEQGREGDALLAAIDEWGDASVTFDPVRTTHRATEHHGRITQRAEIRIVELALAPSGLGLAKGAEVLMVRSAQPAGRTPRLDEARRRRAALLLP